MAIYYKGVKLRRIQRVGKGATSMDDKFLIETIERKSLVVACHRLAADPGADEIVETEKRTKGGYLNDYDGEKRGRRNGTNG